MYCLAIEKAEEFIRSNFDSGFTFESCLKLADMDHLGDDSVLTPAPGSNGSCGDHENGTPRIEGKEDSPSARKGFGKRKLSEVNCRTEDDSCVSKKAKLDPNGSGTGQLQPNKNGIDGGKEDDVSVAGTNSPLERITEAAVSVPVGDERDAISSVPALLTTSTPLRAAASSPGGTLSPMMDTSTRKYLSSSSSEDGHDPLNTDSDSEDESLPRLNFSVNEDIKSEWGL